ncbi:uncharacterized protein LOC106058558 [Biomphalaria glabrata]|uniref:Uncharacterized protein LOC106058558 n=1 Tax=Biomphalaria glabrata TaxID=6526 RepID=A0A9W2ZWE6_BIOGL|nr:uncharacterized protein LOC106058558 [Biomphalaria glabrata]
MNIFNVCFVFLCLMTSTIGLYMTDGTNLNDWPKPKPNPDTCRDSPGFQLYRNKNVQMCLKFNVFGSPVEFRKAKIYCSNYPNGNQILKRYSCGVYEPKNRLLVLDDCYEPGTLQQSCAFGAVYLKETVIDSRLEHLQFLLCLSLFDGVIYRTLHHSYSIGEAAVSPLSSKERSKLSQRGPVRSLGANLLLYVLSLRTHFYLIVRRA